MRFLISRTSERHLESGEPPAPGAVRTEDGEAWRIELTTLEDLANMIDALEEPLILSRRRGAAGMTAIEIYDDMRE